MFNIFSIKKYFVHYRMLNNTESLSQVLTNCLNLQKQAWKTNSFNSIGEVPSKVNILKRYNVVLFL